MTTLLRALGTISGIILIGAIMLMSPKGGLGFGIGGAGGNNEYGSKKSIEYTLKRVALVCAVVTVLVFLAIPYTTRTVTTTETNTGSSLLNNLQQNTLTGEVASENVASTGTATTGTIVSTGSTTTGSVGTGN